MQQTEIDQKMPEEVQELLTKVDRYLMLHQFMTADTDKAGFIDVFLVSMLRRGDLQIVDLVEDSEKTKDFRNIYRLQCHIGNLFIQSDPNKFDEQEDKMFLKILDLTSTNRFLEAIEQKNV